MTSYKSRVNLNCKLFFSLQELHRFPELIISVLPIALHNIDWENVDILKNLKNLNENTEVIAGDTIPQCRTTS